MQCLVRFILATVLTLAFLPLSVAHTQNDTCTVSASNDVNKRTGPDTTFERTGVPPAGTTANVRYQTAGADGYIWQQLEDGSWEREDVVEEMGNGSIVPTYSSDYDQQHQRSVLCPGAEISTDFDALSHGGERCR